MDIKCLRGESREKAPVYRGSKWQRGKSRSPLFTGTISGKGGRSGTLVTGAISYRR
jgi:hypothetical protein